MGLVILESPQRALQPRRPGQPGLPRIEGEKRLGPPMECCGHMQDVRRPMETGLGMRRTQLPSLCKNESIVHLSDAPYSRLEIGAKVLQGLLRYLSWKSPRSIHPEKTDLKPQSVLKLENHQRRNRGFHWQRFEYFRCFGRVILQAVSCHEKGCLGEDDPSPRKSSSEPSCSFSWSHLTSSIDKGLLPQRARSRFITSGR